MCVINAGSGEAATNPEQVQRKQATHISGAINYLQVNALPSESDISNHARFRLDCCIEMGFVPLLLFSNKREGIFNWLLGEPRGGLGPVIMICGPMFAAAHPITSFVNCREFNKILCHVRCSPPAPTDLLSKSTFRLRF